MRSGSGKVRHLSIKELWVQDVFRREDAKVRAVDTLLNWADIGTKALDKERLESLVKQLPIRRPEGLVPATAAAALAFIASMHLVDGADETLQVSSSSGA